MKYTGWAVLIIGVLMGIYGLFAMTPANPTMVPQPDGVTPGSPNTMGLVALGFSAIAIIAGVAMLLFGGSGVIKTKNLAVRN